MCAELRFYASLMLKLHIQTHTHTVAAVMCDICFAGLFFLFLYS